jgi:uncharacterized protein with LGFP repeats
MHTHEIRNAIFDRWDATGLYNSSIGTPITDELAWNGGVYNDFERGSIYASPTTDAWEIPTKIRDKWRSVDSGRKCGFPTAAPHTRTVWLGGISQRITSQQFQRGTVAYSDLGTPVTLNCP